MEMEDGKMGDKKLPGGFAIIRPYLPDLPSSHSTHSTQSPKKVPDTF